MTDTRHNRIAHRLRTLALSSLLSVALAHPLAAAVDRAASVQHFGAAKAYIAGGKLNEALIELKNALKNDPDNIEARVSIGDVYLKLRDGPYAEKEFKAALSRGHPRDQLAARIARSYLLQGKFDDIVTEFKPEGLSRERQPEVLDLRGQAFFALGRIDEAGAAFDAAARAAPKFASPVVGAARVLLKQGAVAAAVAKVDEALRRDPASFDALVLKGQVQRMKGEFGAALRSLDAAVARDPGNIQGLLPRAAVLVDLKRYDAALADLAAAEKKYPNHPIAGYLRALSLARQNKLDAARNALMPVKGLENYPPAIYLDGAIAYAQGRYEQASASLKRFVQADPDHPAAKRLLAATYLRSGEPEEAIALLGPLAEGGVASPQVHALLGSAFMATGQYDLATDQYERAAAGAPKNGALRTKLAVSRLASGEHAAALNDLVIALDSDPGAVQAAVLLAMNSLRAGRFDESLAAARALKVRYPKNPMSDNLIGHALLAKRDLKGARRSFESALALDGKFEAAAIALARMDADAKDFAGAEKRLTAILGRNGRSIGAMMSLAELAEARGDAALSAKWLKKAAATDPGAPGPRLAIVEGLIARGELDKAALEADEYVRSYPDRAQAHEIRGLVELRRGDSLGAVASFSKMAELAPGSAKAHLLRARAEIAASNAAGARAALKRAIALSPSDPAAKLELIRLEIREGRLDEALSLAEAFLSDSADRAVANLAVGDVYFATGRLDEALQAYEASHTARPNAELASRLYRTSVRLGRAEEGVAHLNAWLAQHPGDHPIRLMHAGALIDLDRHRAAIAEYEKLPGDQRKSALVLNNLAWLYHKVGDPRALDMATTAYSLNPNSPSILDTLGWILLSRGKAKDALGHLRMASGIAPRSPQIRYHLAAALYRDGQTKEARQILSATMKQGVEFKEKAEAGALLAKLGG